jgi:hypothetical protein
MKVCEQYGPSIHNVAETYLEYAPEELVEWVDDWIDADVCIDHLIGTPDRANLVHPLERSFSEDVKARLEVAKIAACTPFEEGPPTNLRVAYVMHCAIVDDEFYREAFDMAIVSTGFLDAPAMCPGAFSDAAPQCDWIRVAWGVDPADFLLGERYEEPEYLIYTFGAAQDPEVEYIETIYKAVKRVGGKMLHSGLDYEFDNGEHYVFVKPAKTKAEIAQRYNKCWFANAMRKEEGFELANIEAPLANAIPITLNFGSYEHFFSGYCPIRMDPNVDDMVRSLCIVFDNRKTFTLDAQSKRRIIEKFNWRDTVEPFWQRILEGVNHG